MMNAFFPTHNCPEITKGQRSFLMIFLLHSRHATIG
jgi:hypothetical protein